MVVEPIYDVAVQEAARIETQAGKNSSAKARARLASHATG